MARTTAEPDSVRDPDAEGHTPLPMDRDPASPAGQQDAPASSGSHPRHADNERWHEVAKLLVFTWAVLSSLTIIYSLVDISYADHPVTGRLLWPPYAAAAVLASWVTVLLVWRRPAAGAVGLLAGFLYWLVFPCQAPRLTCWIFLLFCPALLTLPLAAAVSLHLRESGAPRLASDRPSPPANDD